MRRNQVIREGGYDGQFGKIRLFRDSEKEATAGQMALFMNLAPKAPVKSPPRHRPKKGRTKRVMVAHPTPELLKDPILDPLNPEQRVAVLHREGHLLVVAGPGTGKTMTLTHRIAHIIFTGKAQPEQVLALTFTRKAAGEMGERISRLLPDDQGRRIRVATFHRFCLKVLRNHGSKTGLPPDFALCSEVDAEEIAGDVLKRSGLRKPSMSSFQKALPGIKTQLAIGSLTHPPDQQLLALC